MKVCTACQSTKQLTEYFIKDKKSGRLHSQCKQCYAAKRKLYYAEHYKKYGDKYRLRANARKALIRSQLRTQLLAYLSDKSCVVCGMSDPRTLDFDHLEQAEKSFGVAKAMSNIMPWDVILQEIKKCQILCANCHRIRTAEQFGWYKNPIG